MSYTRTLAGCCGGVALAWLCGCDRSDSPVRSAHAAGAAATRAPSPRSPAETVRAARQLNSDKRVDLLRELLVPEQRAEVIELLQAVDRVVLANQVLQARIKSALGAAAATRFDRSEIANAVGPFSPGAVVVDERLEGDQAVVTYQIQARVPLSEINLLRRDEHWLIRTDPPIPGLAEEMRNLAEALTRVAERIQSQHLDADGIEQELDLRQRPILKRMAALTQKSKSP